MERLTSSEYIMNIHGYCGQSAVTELAFLDKGMNNLYRLASGLKGVNTPYVLKTKLQIAAMVSLGLSHIHSVAQGGIETKVEHPLATIAHYDINPTTAYKYLGSKLDQHLTLNGNFNSSYKKASSGIHSYSPTSDRALTTKQLQ